MNNKVRKAVIFKKVNKSFSIGRENRLKKVLSGFFGKDRKVEVFRNVSFTVEKNQTVGIYGPNGSGKSTILRLISKIIYPDSGSVSVVGRVSPILDLGSGLHPELTGSENIYLYSSILGVDRTIVKKNFSKIVSFSELGDFIDIPIKKYSTGMKARLGFSIAIFSEPDVLLVDEVLAVGDLAFQQKCIRYLKEMKRKITIILVSHNLSLLLSLCDRIITVGSNGIYSESSSTEFGYQSLIKYLIDKKNIGFETVCLSESMYPLIKKGDMVTLKRFTFKKLDVGDVIAFKFDNLSYLIIHRIISRAIGGKQEGFLTKGDASNTIDPWIVTKKEYIGKVIIKSNK